MGISEDRGDGMDRCKEISIRREVLLEGYAGILVRFLDYFEKEHINPETAVGDSNVFLFLQTVEICQNLIHMDSMEELLAAEGQFRLLRRTANRLNGYPVDAPV